MKKIAVLILCFYAIPAYSLGVPLRNIISVKGMQENPVIGYGVVVGLKGTGDSVKNSQTKDILAQIALKFGYYLDYDKMQTKNSAIVMVTASLPPLAGPGNQVDVKVSSIFDAKSLEGGELLVTPLISGDGKMYAVAQGSLDVGEDRKAVTARIPLGGLIQRDIPHEDLSSSSSLTLMVQSSLGIESIQKVSQLINDNYPGAVQKQWQNQLELTVPSGKDVYAFITELMNLSVDLEQAPRVLVDSRTGLIVTGGNVIITESAISFQGTRIEIGGPMNWSDGSSQNKNVHQLNSVTTVQDLVTGLNALGAGTREIIQILQMLYQNGNLKAVLEVR